jgi:hypothetical protein
LRRTRRRRRARADLVEVVEVEQHRAVDAQELGQVELGLEIGRP